MTFERRHAVATTLSVLLLASCALMGDPKVQKALDKAEPIVNDSIEILTCAKYVIQMARDNGKMLLDADALNFCRAFDSAPALPPGRPS